MYADLTTKIKRTMGRLKRDARGVSAIEYAILAAVIIGVVSVAATKMNLGSVFSNIGTKVQTAVETPQTETP